MPSTALRTFYGTLADLHRRPPGSGFRQSDAETVAFANNRIKRALADQETRILGRKPMKTLTQAEAAEFGGLLQTVIDSIRASAIADEVLQGRA